MISPCKPWATVAGGRKDDAEGFCSCRVGGSNIVSSGSGVKMSFMPLLLRAGVFGKNGAFWTSSRIRKVPATRDEVGHLLALVSMSELVIIRAGRGVVNEIDRV